MTKLYRHHQYSTQWVAFTDETGWVIFPAAEGGWEQRRPARGLDPMHIRQVPLWMACSTGMPGASETAETESLPLKAA